MFGFLRRKKDKPPASAVELISKAKAMEPLLEGLAAELVSHYKHVLVAEDITYIVPAVWGATMDGGLTTVQREMNGRVLAVLDQLRAILDLKGVSASQSYAVEYLLRGLVISKVAYLVEGLKGRLSVRVEAEPDEAPVTDWTLMDTVGSA